MGIPVGAQAWSTGQGQTGRSAAECSGPDGGGMQVARAQPFPVLGLPVTAHGGFFPTLGILCTALRAASIHGPELARELHPVSALRWANGPARCLARVRRSWGLGLLLRLGGGRGSERNLYEEGWTVEASGRVTSWQCWRPVVLEDVSRPGGGCPGPKLRLQQSAWRVERRAYREEAAVGVSCRQTANQRVKDSHGLGQEPTRQRRFMVGREE